MIEDNNLHVAFLLAPLWEAACAYVVLWRNRADGLNRTGKILRLHLLGVLGALVALLPTFITRQIVFGSPFSVGPYSLRLWNWSAPACGKVLFSASHGLCLSVVLAFYGLVSSYPGWSGVFGFGNRYFVSLTPLFVLGLACALAFAERWWRDHRRASLRLVPLILIFVIWNLGLVYQWCTYLMPARSAVYWDEVIYTQFREVPMLALHDLVAKFFPQSN
jgi:hypothetical protein